MLATRAFEIYKVWKRSCGHVLYMYFSMLLEISGEITPERMKRWSQSKNNTQLRICLVIEAKSNAKKQYCIGTWNARSMNQGKLEMVKQEIARVNVDILGNQRTKMDWNG